MQPPAPFTAPWQARLFGLVDQFAQLPDFDRRAWRARVEAASFGLANNQSDLDPTTLTWTAWLISFEAVLRETQIASPMQLGSVLQAVRISAEMQPEAFEPNTRLIARALGQS